MRSSSGCAGLPAANGYSFVNFSLRSRSRVDPMDHCCNFIDDAQVVEGAACVEGRLVVAH